MDDRDDFEWDENEPEVVKQDVEDDPYYDNVIRPQKHLFERPTNEQD